MGKVLIVEDNELNLKLFHDLLIMKEHKVVISRDGLNIVEMVIEHQPDLILMDIQLAEISGIDLIKALKKNLKTKKIPIIAITAFAMRKDEIRISESGCDLYLPKPVSIDHFFHSVEKFVREPSIIKVS